MLLAKPERIIRIAEVGSTLTSSTLWDARSSESRAITLTDTLTENTLSIQQWIAAASRSGEPPTISSLSIITEQFGSPLTLGVKRTSDVTAVVWRLIHVKSRIST